MNRPILYSFRRCPYAIRARLALRAANVEVELREVVLKSKPPAMLEVSAKATVPVLVTPSEVIDESIEIMQWAFSERNSPQQAPAIAESLESLYSHSLIRQNDDEFKPILDRYKYFDRYPEFSQDDYFQLAAPILENLDSLIKEHGGFLQSSHSTVVDMAVLPFVRQFAHVDLQRWNDLPLLNIQRWLTEGINSNLFQSVMKKYTMWVAEKDNSEIF